MDTTPRRPKKQEKPSPDFPLTPHVRGYWQKKHGGIVYRFSGSAAEALAEYQAVWPSIVSSGVDPRTLPGWNADGSISVVDLCETHLARREEDVRTGDLSKSQHNLYYAAARQLVDRFGDRPVASLTPADFASLRSDMLERFSARTVGHHITSIKTIFRWAEDEDVLDRAPKFGSSFRPPRKDQAGDDAARLRAFTPEEVGRLLRAVDSLRLNRDQWRAMILLGLNTAMGAGDLAALPSSHIDARPGWHSWPRVKNRFRRRCPLWPETIAAIDAYRPQRPNPSTPDAEPLLFLTSRGLPWIDPGGADHARRDSHGPRFRAILEAAGLYEERRGFYELRRTFRTACAGCKAGPVKFIMGHAGGSLGEDVYLQDYPDEMLQEVADAVRSRVLDANCASN